MHLVWHRADLRVHDNPALADAASAAKHEGGTVLPLVIIDRHIFERGDLTPRRRAWFLANVAALREQYLALGADLIVREGKPAAVLAQLIQDLRAAKLPLKSAHWIRNYTPYATQRDAAAGAVFDAEGIVATPCDGQYVREPGTVLKDDGTRYAVYSAFGKRWAQNEWPEPAPMPQSLPPLPNFIARGPISEAISDIALPPAGETAAIAQLDAFVGTALPDYAAARDFPALCEGTSRLSHYLNIGVLSPRLAAGRITDPKWRSELAWRDFLADVLHAAPESANLELREIWRGFPWREDAADLAHWQSGETGIPFVDAGMRELRQTGFMHNRARMVTASFLVKHLLLDWRAGEEFFRGQLMDGDTAQNVGNWQWVAGSGCDAAPYFRVFNPVSQGRKCDLHGDYVRRWLPELQNVPDKYIHEPWHAPVPPPSYPPPMLDLDFGRERFLQTARDFLRRDA